MVNSTQLIDTKKAGAVLLALRKAIGASQDDIVEASRIYPRPEGALSSALEGLATGAVNNVENGTAREASYGKYFYALRYLAEEKGIQFAYRDIFDALAKSEEILKTEFTLPLISGAGAATKNAGSPANTQPQKVSPPVPPRPPGVVFAKPMCINALLSGLAITQTVAASTQYRMADLDIPNVHVAYGDIFSPEQLFRHFCDHLKAAPDDVIKEALGKPKSVNEAMNPQDLGNIGRYLCRKYSEQLKAYDVVGTLYRLQGKAPVAELAPQPQKTPSMILGRGLTALRVRARIGVRDNTVQNAVTYLTRHNISISSKDLECIESGRFNVTEQNKNLLVRIAQLYSGNQIKDYEALFKYAKEEAEKDIATLQRHSPEKRGGSGPMGPGGYIN